MTTCASYLNIMFGERCSKAASYYSPRYPDVGRCADHKGEQDLPVNVESLQQLRDVLSGISFNPSCVNMDWQWDIKSVYANNNATVGWLINTYFQRPDTHTGEVGTGKGRQMFIPFGDSISGVVKTAWLCAELVVRHELMEAFCFNGRRLFDPHKSVYRLIQE